MGIHERQLVIMNDKYSTNILEHAQITHLNQKHLNMCFKLFTYIGEIGYVTIHFGYNMIYFGLHGISISSEGPKMYTRLSFTLKLPHL